MLKDVSMSAADPSVPPDQGRAPHLKVAVAAALDSPEFGSLPGDVQAALKSHNREENLRGLWEFARIRALRSPHFGDLPDWAREAFIENDSEFMPDALRELNRIRSMSSAPSDKRFEIIELPERDEQELVPDKPPRKRRRRRRRTGVRQLALVDESKGRESSTVPEAFERQDRQTRAPAGSSTASPLPVLPKSPTTEQAIDWLKEILSRRRDFVDPGIPYHIPRELLSPHGTLATGPSIVEGDAPVTFQYLQPMGEDLVAVYGSRGSKRGHDMPLVSKGLMAEMKRALRRLPGYTEICWTSGEPLEQPLNLIARKLLKGRIKRVEGIRFWRESTEAHRRRIEEDLAAVRSSPDRPPVEEAITEKLIFSVPLTPQMLDSSLRLRGEILRISEDPSAQPQWTRRIPVKIIMDHARGGGEDVSLSSIAGYI